MLQIHLDLTALASRQALYSSLLAQSNGPASFGHNLDALWDWLTAGMVLPALIIVHGVVQSGHSPEFSPVLALLREAEQTLHGQLRLRVA